jgi:hypothetical protein
MGETQKSTIGTSEGDALSPILFIIYLDAALKEYWWEVFGSPDTVKFLYCMYADDTDFISSLYSDNQYIKVTLPIILEKWNLFMNLGKT